MASLGVEEGKDYSPQRQVMMEGKEGDNRKRESGGGCMCMGGRQRRNKCCPSEF